METICCVCRKEERACRCTPTAIAETADAVSAKYAALGIEYEHPVMNRQQRRMMNVRRRSRR